MISAGDLSNPEREKLSWLTCLIHTFEQEHDWDTDPDESATREMCAAVRGLADELEQRQIEAEAGHAAIVERVRADTLNQDHTIDPDEQAANARLIAAAHELFEVCERIGIEAKETDLGIMVLVPFSLVAAARVAIFKAKGGQ